MKKNIFALIMIIAFSSMLILTSCGRSGNVVIQEEIQVHVITDTAELRRVSMELRPVASGSKETVVVFTITLKNVSNTPLVFNAIAIVGDEAAGQGFIPNPNPTADDPVGLIYIMPGQEGTDRVAVMYDRIPTNFVLFVDVAQF
ncbi:MAG: hypothetical protein FWD87_10385 [Spirochaetaceae bacterium]|nr:hypothetical protein [Spirochaetaceae bacterium]